jgi:hypothetical protein
MIYLKPIINILCLLKIYSIVAIQVHNARFKGGQREWSQYFMFIFIFISHRKTLPLRPLAATSSAVSFLGCGQRLILIILSTVKSLETTMISRKYFRVGPGFRLPRWLTSMCVCVCNHLIFAKYKKAY